MQISKLKGYFHRTWAKSLRIETLQIARQNRREPEPLRRFDIEGWGNGYYARVCRDVHDTKVPVPETPVHWEFFERNNAAGRLRHAPLLSWVGRAEAPADRSFFALRLGELFFMDQRLVDCFSGALRTLFSNQALRVAEMEYSSCGTESVFKYYTMAAVSAILDQSWKDVGMVDCGAGDGLLSLAALRAGAPFALLIEIVPDLCQRAEMNLLLNGYRWGEHFYILRGDLRDLKGVAQVPTLPRRMRLVSNIGTWSGTYPGVSNSTSLALVRQLEWAKKVRFEAAILGGYSLYCDDHGRPHLSRPRLDYPELGRQGFRLEGRRHNVIGSEAFFYPRA